MKEIKVIISVLLSICLIFVLVSCKSPGTDSANNGASQEAESVEITFIQTNGEFVALYQKIADSFMAANSHVTIKVLDAPGDSYDQVMQSYFSSTPEEAPTIFVSSLSENYILNDYRAVISDSRAAGIMIDSVRESVMKDGELYGLPTTVQGYGFVYNKSLFEEAGINTEDLTTMEAFLSACKKLQMLDGVSAAVGFGKETYFSFMHPVNYGIAINDDYINLLNQVDNGELTFNEIPSMKQWITDVQELLPYTNHFEDYYDDLILKFSTGQYAMILQGDWIQTSLDTNAPDFEYGMIPFPTNDNTSLAVDAASMWSINKHATKAQQKAAVEFLDWLYTSEEGQDFAANTLNFIPAYKDVKTPDSVLAKAVTEYANQDKTIPWAFTQHFPSGIEEDGSNLMQQFVIGSLSMQEFLTNLTDVWVKLAK